MEKNKKLKIGLSLGLALLTIAYLAGILIYFLVFRSRGNGLRAAIWFDKGGMGYAMINSLSFKIDVIGEHLAISVGALSYFGILAFLLALIMVISKKCFRYLSNPFVSIIGFLSAAYFLGGIILSNDEPTGPASKMKMAAIIFFVLGIVVATAGFIFSMVFPFLIQKEEVVETVPDRIAKNEVITKPSTREEPVAPKSVEEKPLPEEKPADEEIKQEEPKKQIKEKPVKKEKKAAKPAPKEEEVVEETPAKPIEEEQKPVESVASEEKEEPAPKEEEPLNEEPVQPEAPVEDTPVQEESPVEEFTAPNVDEENSKVTGKYEVFKEAGFWKYRLKANNGEILIVSTGYKSKSSAHSGIETLKRNMVNAKTRIVTDKNGYAQFRISSSNDSRMIATGEIYQNEKSASSALASVMKFYQSEKVNVIDELPENEIREWEVEFPKIVKAANGKVLVMQEDGKYLGKLVANNGETLFVTPTYSSRKALLNAIENLKEKIGDARITIARDKQNRYQFRVFSENGMLLLVGETYPSKDGAISSATSMRNFLGKAKIVG